MTQTPKVTIIIPVYNVEQYLRQCLDSVVNQTMREIQIICVNDGSTDGSSAILEEYVARDPRMEVYHQENQGGGSARNAAYPYIRGKYTYFVDPDDWLELDLCQQCRDKAETTKADFVMVRHMYNADPTNSTSFDSTLPEIRQSPEERYELLMLTATWQRFWLSDFLLSNNIRFFEGKRPSNDTLVAWKGTVLADHIAVLNHPLYHYRIRSDSYQNIIDEKHFIIVDVFMEIKKMLYETEQYESYKNSFNAVKFRFYHYQYKRLSALLRSKFLQLVCQTLDADDHEFFRTAPKKFVPRHIRCFCEMIDGNPGLVVAVNYRVALIIYDVTTFIAKIARMPKRLLFQKIVNRLKNT